MSFNTEIFYDQEERGFLFRVRITEEMKPKFVSQKADELAEEAVAFGEKLYNEFEFLTVPSQARVYVRGVDANIFELRCRLPLADTDDVLDTRDTELRKALNTLKVKTLAESK